MFTRVLVANRGEIAVRVIRALHELGIEAVAIYSTADKDALHVRLADQAVHVGPPPAAESYLRIPSVIAAATTTGCQAVHPGYGFLAENPAFVEACVDNDLVFVGPPADVMATMGDKISAKQAMRAAEVPTVPGTEGATNVSAARAAAEEIGFPILLKATAGGGGKGMRLVTQPDELEDAFGMAAAEAEAAFGDATMYVEKALVPARHVEIQVLCDHHGNVLTLGERECSIQRRHQKLIEESPSAALDPEAREAMELAAERACRAVGYRNAGTFEFLLGPDGSFYFIELNARLQVEHPVTELCTGIDLVREQLLVAAGEELSVTGRAPRRGHAIEIRLNAEDPEHDFRPSPGRIGRLRASARPGRARRHVRRVGLDDLAVLRLDGREADRLGQRPAGRDRARRARAARDDRRGRADDARPRARGARERAVPKRRLLDVDARGAAGAGRMTISRRQARRQALFLLYQWDLSGQEIGSQYAGEIDPWARGVAEAVAEPRARARRAHHLGLGRLDGRPAGRRRAQRPARRRARADDARGPGRGGDQRGRRVHQALCIRRRCEARERHSGSHPTRGGCMTSEESLNNAEHLLARLEAARVRLDETQDPDQAIEILQELAELAKEVEGELQRAKRAAETEAAAPPGPDAAAD